MSFLCILQLLEIKDTHHPIIRIVWGLVVVDSRSELVFIDCSNSIKSVALKLFIDIVCF